MSLTNRQFVESAFEELGLASYTFDLQPDAIQSGLKRLGTMLAEWNARGIRLGATIAFNPDDDTLDAQSGIPDRANEAVITNLAVRIGPSFGKSALPETKITAKNAYNQLLMYSALPTERRLQRMVAGQGNKPWIYAQPFIPETPASLDTGSDGPLEFD